MGEWREGSTAQPAAEQSTEAAFCWILGNKPFFHCAFTFSPACTAASVQCGRCRLCCGLVVATLLVLLKSINPSSFNTSDSWQPCEPFA